MNIFRINPVLILISGVGLLVGCATINKIHPNTATQLLPKHSNLQHICDYAGGCENVTIKCTRYDGKGNSAIRNKTVWEIETGSVSDNNWEYGISLQDNSQIDTHQAIEDAIDMYWQMWRLHKDQAEEKKEKPETVYPNSTSCDQDCLK